MFKKVLLAADGSKHALSATDKAIELLGGNKSFVDVIYVVSGEDSKRDVLHHTTKQEINARRRRKLTEVENKLISKNIDYNVHILHGEPGPTIVEFANNAHYDCVVIGNRGLNPFQSLVLGSVSHKVAKRVQAPVLIVK
ncbi:universal stress protein [Alkalihalobacillus deserti]|uniref:universal stress protein n=1 Tax=Alkalihalobacillus deserti TaxID=2879466 RepID=UPI001D145778|nr:universal stress protein [Alkalihalobacillus deserti]